MLWLAHDGSLNADWLAHYAIRMALRLPGSQVCALFVKDGSLAEREFHQRLKFMERECARADVTLLSEALTLKGSVATTLLARVPKGPDSYLLCGTRARQRSYGFLTGTVSERLLASRKFNVLALRIVHPGMLGVVHDVLAPVMGHPRGFASGLPFMKLLAAELQSVHLLMVRIPARFGLKGRTAASALRQRLSGQAYVDKVAEALRQTLPERVRLDSSVIAGSDPVSEILVAAKQHKSQLIYLGASERGLTKRLVSGTPYEKILQRTPCDVAIYRGVS